MKSSCLALFAFLTSCSSPPPTREYTLARTALFAAKDAEASRFAASYWHEAEEAFRNAEALFKKEDYRGAAEEFLFVKKTAEKAEEVARLQKLKNGDDSQ
jgi:hypothetical protein